MLLPVIQFGFGLSTQYSVLINVLSKSKSRNYVTWIADLTKSFLLVFRKKIWLSCPPLGPTPLFLEAIINCLCRVRRFVWQAKMTNRKKSIKICVCVHPPIYSSDHLALPASHKNNFHYY